MILLINNQPVAIKADTSIEYNSTNPLFGDREDYTLNIELPLDNATNMKLFGRLDRLDTDINDLYLDAEIIDGEFRKSGAVAITSVTEAMVKVQFLADRSFQNFYPDFDKQYIDELDLPPMPKWIPDNIAEQSNGWTDNRNTRPSSRGNGATARPGSREGSQYDDVPVTAEYKTPVQAWGNGDIIALPWVNAASGNIQNRADYGLRNGSNQYYWHVAREDEYDTEAVRYLSPQIRLYKLTELICTALGYTFDAAAWAASDYYHLYSFNCLPAAWDDLRWQETLPHWSINEFFEQLMALMLCDIKIDHKAKKISFAWQENNTADAIALEEIVDEHTATVTKEDDSQYKPARNIRYADGGHEMSQIYACPWYFFKNNPKIQAFESMQAIANWLVNYVPRQGTNESLYLGYGFDIIFYAEEEDMYFLPYVTKRVLVDPAKHTPYARYGNIYRLIPLNAFGTRVIDEENWDEADEISIIPAWLDDTDFGPIPFFNAGTEDEDLHDIAYKQSANSNSVLDADRIEPDQVIQPYSYRFIREGEKNKKTNFSTLQVAFWYGMEQRTWGNEGDLPRPFLTKKEFVTVWGHYQAGNAHAEWGQWQVVLSPGNGSLRLNTSQYGLGAKMEEWIKIDTNKKYEISFLYDAMPDVKSVYVIKGKRYLCANIKTEITTDGMSRLKKGTFYRVLS